MWKNKIRVYIHFVWATWDRLPLVKPDFERELHRCISAICENDKCTVLALNGMEDHIHLFVELAPTISMADLMKDVKGGSSRFVSEELSQADWFKWQGHYGAFSVSLKDRAILVDYIRNQKQHHADGSLWPSTEEPAEEYVYLDHEAQPDIDLNGSEA